MPLMAKNWEIMKKNIAKFGFDLHRNGKPTLRFSVIQFITNRRFNRKVRKVEFPSKVTTPLKVNIQAMESTGLSWCWNNFKHVAFNTFHNLNHIKILLIILEIINEQKNGQNTQGQYKNSRLLKRMSYI